MTILSSARPLYPFTFAPIFKDYPWGGRNLASKLGRSLPEGIVAESWEIAAHPNGASTVDHGPLAGLTLPQLQERLGEVLIGSRNRSVLAQGKFPLLIKLLDANRWLSVQVHPDDEYALAHEGEFGKTEMWVVLYAEPGAELICGFKRGVDREIFTRAIAEECAVEFLHHIPVSKGDVIFVPAGAVHALGPGLIVAEIQQNSDTTYRIYDWGRPRPLHIAKSLDVLDYSLVEPKPLKPQLLAGNGYRRERIGRCRHFDVERLSLPAGGAFAGNCDGSTFEIWGVIQGGARIYWQEGELELAAVRWALLPARLGAFKVQALEESVLLRVLTP
jgi:mannose-6-phosphate isomerase